MAPTAELLVIVPTRSRPHNLRRMLQAWDDTAAWECAALVAAVDADDSELPGYRQVAEDRRGDDRHWWLSELGQWRPMVAKLDNVAAANVGRFFALGFMGDDHVPRTPGWASRYLDTLRELGTGIVYGDDLVQGENIPTQWVMTADIVRALGRMVPAPVEHLYSDNSILALGRAAGCIRYLGDVVIEHCHPVNWTAPLDDQYRRVNSPDQYKRDGAAYRRWVGGRLDSDVAKVKALREVADGAG